MKKLIATCLLSAASSTAFSAAILTQGGGYYGGLLNGGLFSTEFQATHNVTTGAIDNSSYMSSFDALYLNDELSGSMTGAEISAVSSFISGGKKAVFITDNNGWANWNNSIEAIIGAGTINDTCSSTPGTITSSHQLVNGMAGNSGYGCNSVLSGAGNVDLLFSNNMAGLFQVGAGEALVITSVDFLSWDSRYNGDNAIFGTNIIEWLDTPLQQNVSEPGTLALLGLGLAGLGFSRKKKAA